MSDDLLKRGGCVLIGPDHLRALYRMEYVLGDDALDTYSVGGRALLTRCLRCGRYQVRLDDLAAVQTWNRHPRCADCRATRSG